MWVTLLTSLGGKLLTSIIGWVSDWLRRQELEAIKSKHETLKAKVKSMQEAGAEEDKVGKIVKKIAETNARMKTTKEKIADMANHAAGLATESEEEGSNA